MKRGRRFSAAVFGVALCVSAGASTSAFDGAPSIAGSKCTKLGVLRAVKTVSYVCVGSGKSLRWKKTTGGSTSNGSGAVTATTTPQTTVPVTTVPSKPCRTTSQITTRLPNELQKREWDAVVAKLQPVVASADSTGRTTAVIDTFEDTSVGNLTYGRYYPMSYPAAVDETQGGRCAYLALVFDVFVRFTGSDRSDDTAKTGIQSAVKALLLAALTNHTKVDGYDVDVILIEPVLDHCPGREMMGSRTICPWNDVGFLYFRTAALTPSQVSSTAASNIFNLSVSGATFPPRPFNQIVGIGASTQAVVAGSVRDLVPSANKTHQASTYVEYSDRLYEIGQTLSVDAALPVQSISIRTVGHVGVVDGRPSSGTGPAIPANVRTRVYRYNGSGDIPRAIRRSDFTKQVDVSQAVAFPHNASVTFNLPSGTTLSAGKYLITFTISGWNPVGSYIRLESFAEGNAGQTDVYAPGKAYRACNLRDKIGYRFTDNPPVADIGTESLGTDCEYFYPEVSKGENPARGMQHTMVWSDIAMTLNAP